MKTKKTMLLTRFEPDDRFDVAPVAVAPFRGTQEAELEQFKFRLLRLALDTTPEAGLHMPLRRAANEAAGVAWLTPFPLLVLPVLFEERIDVARRQFERAQTVRAKSRRLLVEML